MDGKPMDTETVSAAMIDKPVAAEPRAAEVTEQPRAEVAEQSRAPEPEGAPQGTLPTPDTDDPLLRDIIAALKTVYDPEIPADIYELGLIYAVDVDDDRNVAVTMTLTAPGCPVAGEMPKWVENAINAVPGIKGTTVTMTFTPPWDMSRMSDEARLALNMF
jgi:FeS assembly SUF system protein